MVTEKMIEAACDHKGKRVVCPSSAGPCCEGCGEPWPYDETPTPAPSDKIGMPVIQALSRMIDNRHSDRTSSIVSAEDRSLIIDGFHSLMAQAALSTDAEPVEPICNLVWKQYYRAADDIEDYFEVARPGDKCVDGSDPFPVYVAPPTPALGAGLTFSDLQVAHVERQEEWCPDVKPDLSFRGNELGGECGEAQNVIKKLERERHGWRGSRDTVEHLAEELADVIHCTMLVAITAGIDLQQSVVAKFNDTSKKNGLSTILPALSAQVQDVAEGRAKKEFAASARAMRQLADHGPDDDLRDAMREMSHRMFRVLGGLSPSAIPAAPAAKLGEKP